MPHLNIRCECYGSLFLYTQHKQLETLEKTFSRKILIGTCTIKSIGEFRKEQADIEAFCRNSKFCLF